MPIRGTMSPWSTRGSSETAPRRGGRRSSGRSWALVLFAAAFLIAHSLAGGSTPPTVNARAPAPPRATAVDRQLAETVAPLHLAVVHHPRPPSTPSRVSPRVTAPVAPPPPVVHRAKPATKAPPAATTKAPAAAPAATVPAATPTRAARPAARHHRHKHRHAAPAATYTPPATATTPATSAPSTPPRSRTIPPASSKRGSATQSIG